MPELMLSNILKSKAHLTGITIALNYGNNVQW